ncbi:MAG: hypothetical protein Harvfovirus57_5 [Harvfovirus sp.]|uniref:Uncharacterized protein n=1 Tax=Harvfovirus sp. TaxID=2487768 RepID=A0A3G5A3D7_9VIRU|nr:MAG: hypothetical protein Harvfovirus57_5 [Harvfovirus sp.]
MNITSVINYLTNIETFNDEIDEETTEPEDYVITNPHAHWRWVLDELPEDEYSKTRMMYLVRMWNRNNDIYFYKVGITNVNIRSYIRQLDTKYKSCGRIILILLCRVDSLLDETKFHKTMQKYRLPLKIGFIEKKETYNISHDFYGKVYEHMEKYCCEDKVFDTMRYEIDESQTETFRELTKCDELVYLDRGEEEKKFWHIQTI